MINTGFTWMRVDKGNFICCFRYLSETQVQTVINYLKSYYEYNNVQAHITAIGKFPSNTVNDPAATDKNVSEIYIPSSADPDKDYYFLVELFRGSTIIPQGCIEIMKSAINMLATQQIVDKTAFIERFKSDKVKIGDRVTFKAIFPDLPGLDKADYKWDQFEHGTTDESYYFRVITPSTSPDYEWECVAESEGNVDIAITYTETISPYESWEYVRYRDEETGETKYKYAYVEVPEKTFEYRNVYPLQIISYMMLTATFSNSPDDVCTRLCLGHAATLTAFMPDLDTRFADLPQSERLRQITWGVNKSDLIEFDVGGPKYNSLDLQNSVTYDFTAKAEGTAVFTATLIGIMNTYSDTTSVSIFAMDAHPNKIKLVSPRSKTAYILKTELFKYKNDNDEYVFPDKEAVTWYTPEPEDKKKVFIESKYGAECDDAIHNIGECVVTADQETKSGTTRLIAQAYYGDLPTGTAYQKSISVEIGFVAIENVDEHGICVDDITIPKGETKNVDCYFADGWEKVDWVSSNPYVVKVIGHVESSAADDLYKSTVTLTGLSEGSAIVRVSVNVSGAPTTIDDDEIFVRVTETGAVYASRPEMLTFTNNLFSKNGVVDWNVPTDEDGFPTEDGALPYDGDADTATEQEVQEFVDDLFDEVESESSDDTVDEE